MQGKTHKRMIPTASSQRRDIQALRGLAVVLVVLFHLEVSGFRGGFLGVDVFFVISGYLMATMYRPECLKEFFLRRARRLFPAYFTVVAITVFVASVRVTPGDYRQTVDQAMFAYVFASNIGFWLENSYFDKAAFKPLLHLWSLGIEIQFYLLLPVLYPLMRKCKAAVLGLLVISLTFCFVMLGTSTKTAFFWLPFRLWEFLLGYGVATFSTTRVLPAWFGSAGFTGIVCFSVVGADGFSRSVLLGHPGFSALAISLATVAVLYAGIPQRFLESNFSRTMERIGNYSYSIYLAHFPVIVLLLYQPFSGTTLKSSSTAMSVMAGILIILTSTLLFRCVEAPFKKHRASLKYVGVLVLTIPILSWLGVKLQTYLVPEPEMRIYESWFDRDVYRCGKATRIFNPVSKYCEITHLGDKPNGRVMLVGDSHADSIKKSFSAEAEAQNIAVDFIVENNPLRDGGMTADELINIASLRNTNAIVMHYSSGNMDNEQIYKVAALANAAGIRTSYILPVPGHSSHVPKALWKALHQGEKVQPITASEYLQKEHALISGIAGGEYVGIRYYSVLEALCNDACALVSGDGRPLYFDSHHLTLTGSDQLRPVFKRVISELLN